ncbi:MAG: glycosyltransferase family 4 protein [Bdellovibrionales bacterium]
MAKKKLLYVINHMDWFWSHRLPLAVGARDAGWDVSVCAYGAADDTRLAEYGFRGIDLPQSGNGALSVGRLVIALRGIIARETPDLVHAITLKYAFMAGLAALFCPRLRMVHTLAGLGYLFSGEGVKPKILRTLIGPFLKLALSGAYKRIIFQNPDDQALMIRRSFVDADRTHLIRGSGVDTKAFACVEEPAQNPPVITMPTRLVHDKGVAVFIEAAKTLAAQGVTAVFHIAGGEAPHNPNGIGADEMRDMIKGSPVMWLGKVADMPRLYAEANLIVYPSYYGEGVPKVLLEAAATSRAIITTDHPGCREAVTHDTNGLLVPIKDSDALADAIATLLADPRRRAAMGRTGRQRAEEEFDVSKVVAMTLEVYGLC